MEVRALIRVQLPELPTILACGEAVTHRTLTPLSAGSNPVTPTNKPKGKERFYETHQKFSHSLEPLYRTDSRLHNSRRLRFSCGSPQRNKDKRLIYFSPCSCSNLLHNRLDKGRC